MTVTYCTAAEVVARIMMLDPTTGVRKVLDTNSNPTLLEVEARINSFEDYIDQYCRDQWRILASDTEYYSVDNLWPGWFPHEQHCWVRGWKLQQFDPDEGDILKIRRGDEWVDLLDGTYEEGIGKDFWCEYDTGIVHFYRTRPQYGTRQIQVKYRWGHETVPYDIKRACANLVAADLLRGEIYAVVVGAGPGFATNRMDTADRFESEARDILNRHQRLPSQMLGM